MHSRQAAGKLRGCRVRARRDFPQVVDSKHFCCSAQGLAEGCGSRVHTASRGSIRGLSTGLSTALVDSCGNCRWLKGLRDRSRSRPGAVRRIQLMHSDKRGQRRPRAFPVVFALILQVSDSIEFDRTGQRLAESFGSRAGQGSRDGVRALSTGLSTGSVDSCKTAVISGTCGVGIRRPPVRAVAPQGQARSRRKMLRFQGVRHPLRTGFAAPCVSPSPLSPCWSESEQTVRQPPAAAAPDGCPGLVHRLVHRGVGQLRPPALLHSVTVTSHPV
jgi:hypothetical protein